MDLTVVVKGLHIRYSQTDLYWLDGMSLVHALGLVNHTKIPMLGYAVDLAKTLINSEWKSQKTTIEINAQLEVFVVNESDKHLSHVIRQFWSIHKIRRMDANISIVTQLQTKLLCSHFFRAQLIDIVLNGSFEAYIPAQSLRQEPLVL